MQNHERADEIIRLPLTAPDGLCIEASTSPDDGLLREFYAAYDNAFVLTNEKESFEGFVDCLNLNSGEDYARLFQVFGSFREYILILRDLRTNNCVGGANFIAFPLPSPAGAAGHILSLNLNYIFVAPAERGRGIFRRLLTDFPGIAFQLFKQTNASTMPGAWAGMSAPLAVYMFIEQNDPYRMTREDYELDTKYTGLDQRARIAIWARRGAKIVDFAYAQPALTADQEPDHNLVYAVLGCPQPSLDAALMRGHLERFFGISVLKGRDPYDDKTARGQLEALKGMENAGRSVPLLSLPPASEIPAPDWSSGDSHLSLPDILKQF